MYHCYFDFEKAFTWGDASGGSIIIDYLEGAEVRGHLCTVLSRKSFYSPWKDWGKSPFGSKGNSYINWNPERAFQFGINLIVFALTQEGSITHRLLDSIH